MRELIDIRAELDQTDRELVRLFEARMALCRQVAKYKIAHGMQVLDAAREAQVLESRAALAQDPSLAEDVKTLYRTLMTLSRHMQQTMITEAERHA